MKILFSSICTGENYSYWAQICILSFKKITQNYNYKITWDILTDLESLDNLKNVLKYYEDDKLKIRYSILQTVSDEIDVNKYITLGWATYENADHFLYRIKYINDLANSKKYDILVTVDLDSIFIRNPFILIEKFIESGKIYAGAREPFDMAQSFKLFKNVTIKGSMPEKLYFNLGLGFLNLTKLPKEDLWNKFKEMSKGKEYWYNTQDQAFFSYFIDDSDKLVLEDAQIVVHALWKKEYRIQREPCLVHFSPHASDMFKKFNSRHLGPYYLIKFKYFKKFYTIALECKNIPEKYLNCMKYNLKFVSYIFKIKTDFIKILMDFYKI